MGAPGPCVAAAWLEPRGFLLASGKIHTTVLERRRLCRRGRCRSEWPSGTRLQRNYRVMGATMWRRAAGTVAAMMLALLIAGCSSPVSDQTARFVRYETLQDGTRVAVVVPVATGADPAQERAFSRIDDLRPDELVRVRDVGRGWDQAQWMPSAEVVSRASR
jgi:hypothetical protein